MVRIHPDPPVSATGAVAQLGERLLCKQEVIGSIPFSSTKKPAAFGDRSRTSTESRSKRERFLLIFGSDRCFGCSLTKRRK